MKKQINNKNNNNKTTFSMNFRLITKKFLGSEEENKLISKLLNTAAEIDFFKAEKIAAERLESIGAIPYFQMTLDEKWVCIAEYKGDFFMTEPHESLAFTAGSMLLFVLSSNVFHESVSSDLTNTVFPDTVVASHGNS